MAKYVQAWRATKAGMQTKMLYSAHIMVDHIGGGWDIESMTIVRYEDGSREYLPGTVAHKVEAYREANNGNPV